MAKPNQRRFKRFLIALCVGGLLGAVVGTLLKVQQQPGGIRGVFSGLGGEATVAGGVPTAVEESVAWQYARAYQEGRWGRVLELTLWARERLALVAAREGPEALARERDTLMAAFGTRTLIENQLRDTGVEDQYVFTPGARLAFESVDDGRDDLARPVARRTWFTVTYPGREQALLDSENVPIHSLRAGVNVSHDGYVLKANVVGNLDIDWTSIRYDWPSR